MSQNLHSVTSLSPAFFRCHVSQNTPSNGARIALINIMDNAEGTERHFTRTIQAADPNAQITLCRMACAKTDPKYFRERDFLLSDRYVDWHDVLGRQDFDLVIVTGIDRGTLSYDDLTQNYADFWDESKELFRSIRHSIRNGTVGHSALVCWSAFAAMKELYGVEKGIHPEKHYGLFPHSIESPEHPLTKGFSSEDLLAPHSRSSYMEEADLRHVIEEHNGNVIMNADDGPAIWTLEQDRITCFINHLEYSIDTLNREYERDKLKRCPNFPAPQNYVYVKGAQNGENAKLEQVFDRLSETCGHFYNNLIILAKQQKSRENAPHVPEYIEQHQKQVRTFAFGA